MAGSQRIAAVRVEAVADPKRLEALVPQWRDLVRKAAVANVLYSPEMGLAAWRHLAGRERVTWLVAWRGDVMAGIWPVEERAFLPGARFTAVAPWHHALGFLTTPLVHADHVEAVADALAGHIVRETEARVFLQVQASWASPVQQAVMTAFDRKACLIRTVASYDRAALKTRLSGAAYLKEMVGAGRMKTAQRLRRRLEAIGAVKVETARTPAALTVAAEEFLALEKAGWKGRRGTAMAQVPGEAAFLRDAVNGWGKAGTCRVLRLTVDGKCIASLFILSEQKRAWLWKIAYDEAYHRYSPGVLAVIEATRLLLDKGGLELGDSCAPPDYPMIDRLWRQRLPLADMMVVLRDGRIPPDALVAAEKARRTLRAIARTLVSRVRRP